MPDTKQSTTPESTTNQESSGKAPLQEYDPQSAIPGRYIVVLKDDQDAGVDRVAELVASVHADRYGVEVRHVYERALKGYAARIPEAQLEEVRSDPRVLFVSEDREVQTSAQSTPMGIKRIGGESSTRTNKGSGVGVAVIDTGVDLSHPDLSGVRDGKNCVDTSKNANDDHGHGSHVAGTIAARDNDTGAIGVAPEATPYAVKVLNSSGSGTTSQVICGIDWVTANAQSLGIKVANVSLGGSGSDDDNCGNSNSDAQHKAICNSAKPDPANNYPGMTYAVAAGNDGQDLASKVPAAYNEVATVAALADFDGQPGGLYTTGSKCRSDVDDTAADFSNYATSAADQEHTIAAPGVCVYSTWMNGGYNTISGTSMATPHIAGTAALYLANDPAATSTQVITVLREDARTKSSFSGSPPPYYTSPYHGYNNDPTYPNGSSYYGYLEWPGNYFGDTNPLSVGEVLPSDGATQVPLDTNVTATFSGDMDPDTLTTSTVTLAEDGSTTPVAAAVSYDAPTKKVTLDPSANLAANTKYTATIKGGTGGAKDTAGNSLAADKVWSFTTTDDATPPAVASIRPSNRATQVPLDTDVGATFSEDMDQSTITKDTFTLKAPDGSLVAAAVSYDAATRRVTLDPSANLVANTKYTATVKGGTGGAKDTAGNPMAADRVWFFTTTDDTTPPKVIEKSPTGQGNVSRDTNVTAKFSEDVDGATVTLNTFMLARGTSEPTASTKITSGTTVRYDPASQTATLNPFGSSKTRLVACGWYTAKVTIGVTDKVGNPAAGKTVWSFKTGGC